MSAPAHSPLFRRLSDRQLQCLACHHHCVIGPGASGRCRVHGNDGGLRACAAWGRAAVCAAPIEALPLYHFLPGTAACAYGAPGCGLARGLEDLAQLPQCAPEAVVAAALRAGCKSVAVASRRQAGFLRFTSPTVMKR
jgi:pyruvate formate lyase activating enzyme